MSHNTRPTLVTSLLLSGRALDYAVAEILGVAVRPGSGQALVRVDATSNDQAGLWEPSADEALGQRIVKEEGYMLATVGGRSWCYGRARHGAPRIVAFGYSPTEAILRCYVTEKAGSAFIVPPAFQEYSHGA